MSHIQVPETAAPDTPGTGKVRVYAKTDKKLYIKDDAGTETDLTATGAHAATHSDGGSDEVTVENLATGSSDVSTALRPDGVGGLAFSDVAHSDLTGVGTDDHHAKLHAADHSDGGADEIKVDDLGATSTDTSAAFRPDGAGGVAVSDIAHTDLTGVTSDQHHAKLHAADHITGAADEIDGDQLDIDFTPSNYTPTTAPAEATNVDHLTAHLAGIDNAITGGGEANTASNQGVGGVGLFDTKVGVDLQFKNINAGSSKVTVTNDAGNKEVDIDVAEANLTLNNIGGTLGASKGGTGQTSYTIGDILRATGATTLSKLAGVATGNALISGGVGASPSYGKIGLTTHISGTLPIANGGTGQTAKTAAFNALSPVTTKGDIIVRDSTNNIRLAVGTNGQVLTADSAEASGVKWAAAAGGTSFPQFHFYPGDLLFPNNSDWTVSVGANTDVISANNGVRAIFYDDTTEEGRGYMLRIPSTAANVVFGFMSRAGASGNVVPKIYVRKFTDAGTLGAWNAGTDLTAIALDTNYNRDTESKTLASVGLTAGDLYQIELTRNTGSGSDTLTGDWRLIEHTVTFT